MCFRNHLIQMKIILHDAIRFIIHKFHHLICFNLLVCLSCARKSIVRVFGLCAKFRNFVAFRLPLLKPVEVHLCETAPGLACTLCGSSGDCDLRVSARRQTFFRTCQLHTNRKWLLLARPHELQGALGGGAPQRNEQREGRRYQNNRRLKLGRVGVPIRN
jgi:hypothetical protein